MFYGLILIGVLFSYWYQSAVLRWESENTHFPGLQFTNTMTWKRLLWLHVSNLLLILCTFGFGAPWATVRAMKVYIHSVQVQGSLDYVHLGLDEQEAPKYGEGFFEAFDVDIAV